MPYIPALRAFLGLGQAYYKLGERYLLQAREFLERALSIQEAHWGRDHPVRRARLEGQADIRSTRAFRAGLAVQTSGAGTAVFF